MDGGPRSPVEAAGLSSLNVQVFGRRDSRDTQKALRFFKERRVQFSFVDINQRPPAPAELRRFSQRFGAAALLDRESRAYADSGLAYMRLTDDEVFQRLLNEPGLLRLPLVRAGDNLSLGNAEQDWKEWLKT